MKKTLAAEEALEDFLQDYLTWVDKNVEKKERYIISQMSYTMEQEMMKMEPNDICD